MSRALASIIFGASSTLPLVAHRFLIASSSSAVRSANMSSNTSSRSRPSVTAPRVVRPSYRIGTVAPSASDSRIVYVSMNSPKISWVRFFSPMMIGVPVKPIRAQLGRALRRLACRLLECERCASSTRTTIASLSLRSPNGLLLF